MVELMFLATHAFQYCKSLYYYRFGAVLCNLVSRLVLLVHDADLFQKDTPPC